MSRNLGSTSCAFCNGPVVLDEKLRPITREEAGVYYDTHQGYGYAGGLFANATCSTCGAQYLAWGSLAACAGYGAGAGHLGRSTNDERPFNDLSHRAAFNDEPAEEDLPEWSIRTIELTPEQCVKLEAFSGTIVRREPWPRCEKTGRKVWHSYGCDCDEHR
jgi:hypothetical protein